MPDIRMDPSWVEALHSEFSEPYFKQLTDFVRKEYQEQTCYPPGPLIFNAFDSCPWDAVKVVILGQDPYINPGQAMGLSFSVPDGIPKPPSLLNIFKEMQADLGKPISKSGDLSSWAQNGVLLLNSVLTVRAGLYNSHQAKGWERFTDAVIQKLNQEKEKLVFILWGNPARTKGAFISKDQHLVLESAHPSPMSAMRGFFGNHHFSRCNEFLLKNGKEPVNW